MFNSANQYIFCLMSNKHNTQLFELPVMSYIRRLPSVVMVSPVLSPRWRYLILYPVMIPFSAFGGGGSQRTRTLYK